MTVDNTIPPHSETAPPGTGSGIRQRFQEEPNQIQGSETWTADANTHAKTSAIRNAHRMFYRIYLVGGVIGTCFCLLLLFAGLTFYRQATRVDSVKPDYSSLDEESDTYWEDRILIDIETALNSGGTDQVQQRRLRTFTYKTVADAMKIPSAYVRAQAVTNVAMVLAQNDIDIVLDNHLQRLGDTNLIVSMRARTLISQALMYLRQGRGPAAGLALQQYNKLVSEVDLRLDSSLNEESFFGAVTVLHYLGDREGLIELFARQKTSTSAVGIDQRMKAYRMIAGEQVRTAMPADALTTAKQITNSTELVRALALILQYTARPPKIFPVEPVMLDLLDNPQAEPPTYLSFAERMTHDIFQYLATEKDISTQITLLQRLAGSRLMCDVELHKLFRQCLVESTVIQDRVKQPVLNLLDDPESPTIRVALNMPPRAVPVSSSFDSARDDWTTSDEPVHVEVTNIDSTPLRTQNDQQWVQAWLAVAQSYQSIKRFQDAERILKQMFAAAQRFTDANVRTQLLMRIAEQQIAVGSIAEAQRTFVAVAPTLHQNQKEELARLQILARLFNDAFQTIASIETPANREYAGSFLLQEQIRINRLADAEKTWALLPQGRTATECRSRLNIAKGEASRNDFNVFGLILPEGNAPDWERYCIGLIQQGFLRSAEQAANGISNVPKRIDTLTRIAGEYLLLYQAFNDSNDPNRSIRREIQQTIVSVADRTGQPLIQATLLTELLMFHTGLLRTEADRTDGNQLWALAIDACRKITEPDDKTVLFAQLIVVKNLLENPNLLRIAKPLFTRETNSKAFEETNSLINECLALVNLQDENHRGLPCTYLARAAAQIGRTSAAQVLLDRVLELVPNISSHETLIPMLLSAVPALKAMNSADTISVVYRLAIDEIALEFSGRAVNVDVLAWRVRDSEIEQIVRSQLENGFVDNAVESANRLNEPVLRDRLLRTAAYIYLDIGHVERAELEARRLTVKEFQSSAMQNIQIIKQRSKSQ